MTLATYKLYAVRAIVGKNITSIPDSIDILVLIELWFLQIILTITGW